MKRNNYTSVFIGVYFVTKENKFKTRIQIDKKRILLGYFNNELSAALSYDKYIRDNNLDRRLNFPDQEPENLIPNTRLIRLTKGQFAIVDDEDFERVNQFNWYTLKSENLFYAVGRVSNGVVMYMHHFVLENNSMTDHKNRNGLHNYKSNLRPCTKSQNAMNMLPHKDSMSIYKGIWFDPSCEKWHSRITINKRTISIGFFSDEIEAAKKYDQYAKELFGEFACLNFP